MDKIFEKGAYLLNPWNWSHKKNVANNFRSMRHIGRGDCVQSPIYYW